MISPHCLFLSLLCASVRNEGGSLGALLQQWRESERENSYVAPPLLLGDFLLFFAPHRGLSLVLLDLLDMEELFIFREII